MSEWNGIDRRSRPRDDQLMNLDMTWQDAWYSMRRELAALEREISELLHPDTGRFTVLERDIKTLVKLSEQFRGAFKVLSLLGALLALVISSWDTLRGWLK